MTVRELLQSRRKEILKGWFKIIAESYPEQTAHFLRTQKDPFQNPVGAAIETQSEAIFDQIIEGVDRDKVTPFIDRIVRIRALQNFSPSQAMGFILDLKKVLRQVVAKSQLGPQAWEELLSVEDEVDRTACVAFDIFMSCREKLFELQAQEVKSMYYMALKKADIVYPLPQQEEPDLKPPE